MTVPTLTKKQADPREQPGGGKLHPVRHIVRIVVVPFRAGSTPVRQSGGSGQSHDLTEGELKAAEQALKKMDAPRVKLPITTSNGGQRRKCSTS